jgi:acetyl-CoA acetyltransferase
MTPRFAARNQVAIVGYAQSDIERKSSKSLGALTLETAHRAISDAGISSQDVDGFVTAPLFPTFGSHAVQDGVSIVSARWLAQHMGVVGRFEAEVQGQLIGAVAAAVNAIASGAADFILLHRALHNPPGRYHQCSARSGEMDRSARAFRPDRIDRNSLQRIPTTIWR